MEKANSNGVDSSVHNRYISHCAYSQQKDISCCWVASDNMQFIPHVQGICIPHSETQNCLEAHGCTSKHPSKIAPIIGYSIDLFGQNQKLCTCSPQLAKLNLSNEQAAILLGAKHFCPVPSSGNISLSSNIGMEEKCSTKQENLIGHFPKMSEPLKSDKFNDDKHMQFSDINSNVDNDKLPNSVDIQKPEKLRIRGKRLLCPSNATPLYGKTPSWWGDSPPENQPKPAKSDKRVNHTNNRPTNHSYKTSTKTSNHQASLESQPSGNLDGKQRRQSTAFVVSLESSQQSSEMSLSSSLPSFQIGDRLCSYFPVSRKMSFQKRKDSIRRRESLEASDNKNSDAASEHGTYIVDLDVDDIIDEDEIVPDTHLEKNLKSIKDNGKCPSGTSKNSDFRSISDFDKLVIREDKSPKNKPRREAKSSPKKVRRKKTFVVSSDDLKDKLTSTHQNKVKALPNNSSDNILKVVNDKTSFNTHTADQSYILENCLDARQLLKESSWNFNKTENLIENMSFEMPVMKLESPKLISNPNVTKISQINETKVYYSESQTSNSTVSSDGYDMQKETFEHDKKFVQNHEMIDFDETESNLLTSRSIKTELLLKPTKEISLQLKQFKSHSKIQDKINKDKNSLMKNSENVFGSIDSFESFGNNMSESVKDSIYKVDTSSNADTDTNFKLDFPNAYEENGVYLRKRCESALSNYTDSTVEGNRSDFTDFSLGQKIVQKSRSISSASSEISRESFVPPRRKQAMSLQRLVPGNSFKSLTKSPASKQKKASDVLPNKFKPHEERGLVKRSSTELFVRGSSVKNKSNKKELDWKPCCTPGQKFENNNKFKTEKDPDDLFYLTAIMKYSAQIQMLSGNLLELISLRNEKNMQQSNEQGASETTVTSRLSTMLSTMKASNDLLFDLHDFLADQLDEL